MGPEGAQRDVDDRHEEAGEDPLEECPARAPDTERAAWSFTCHSDSRGLAHAERLDERGRRATAAIDEEACAHRRQRDPAPHTGMLRIHLCDVRRAEAAVRGAPALGFGPLRRESAPDFVPARDQRVDHGSSILGGQCRRPSARTFFRAPRSDRTRSLPVQASATPTPAGRRGALRALYTVPSSGGDRRTGLICRHGHPSCIQMYTDA